jgi:transposase, IS30 family
MKEYTHLKLDERKKLYVRKKEGMPMAEIARELKRDKSSLYRELARNTADSVVGYLPDEANNLAEERKAILIPKLDRQPESKAVVVEQLKDGWSPEVIAGRVKLEPSPFRISHEAIYQFIYGNEGQKLGLYKFLLRARPKRGLVHGRKSQKAKIPDRVSIHDRPAHIATREELGHYEGDLTFFTNNQSMNLGVIIERKTRLVRLIMNESKHAVVVMKGMFNKLAELPNFARRSITFDNGLEFVKHTVLRRFMDMDTYFCDKHSPWQKGQVEQMNSMLHRYLPKNSNLREVTHEQIELIENKLNSRPRKCLGFRTPAEAFSEELSKFVALQT